MTVEATTGRVLRLLALLQRQSSWTAAELLARRLAAMAGTG